MKPFLLCALLFITVKCGLVCGIPTGGKFDVYNIKPGNASRPSRMVHHMTLAEGGVVSIRATASVPKVEFTIGVNVTQYDCANVDDDNLQPDHKGCTFSYQRTLSVNDDKIITWKDPKANINFTYCGDKVDGDATKHLAQENKNFNFYKVNKTSVYVVFIDFFTEEDGKNLNLTYRLEMKNWFGYLNLIDYPGLIFYGVMMAVYILFGLIWIILLAISYKDLLKLQFWIALVIFLGMLEKAFFVSMYSSVNETGAHVETRPLYIVAELISSAKKSLARMLLIIVSLGYGTVKPNLDGQMSKVIAVGAIYGVFSFLDGIDRSYSLTDDTSSNTEYFTMIPLVIIDTIILYWVITAIKETRQVLRLRRNVTKLSFYNHLIYMIVFAVVVAIIFMLWSIIFIKSSDCLRDWKELWFDDAFWHILFSFLLGVIMFLWRPSTNSVRLFYAVVYDEEDDFEPEQGPNENFGDIKLRKVDSEPKRTLSSQVEDDLKWAEENLPTSAIDTILPLIVDSDEEVMTTKFEQSKMN